MGGTGLALSARLGEGRASSSRSGRESCSLGVIRGVGGDEREDEKTRWKMTEIGFTMHCFIFRDGMEGIGSFSGSLCDYSLCSL